MEHVIGAQHTLETMSWYNVFGATTSNLMKEAFEKTALSYQDMKSLDLNISETAVKGRLVVNENLLI